MHVSEGFHMAFYQWSTPGGEEVRSYNSDYYIMRDLGPEQEVAQDASPDDDDADYDDSDSPTDGRGGDAPQLSRWRLPGPSDVACWRILSVWTARKSARCVATWCRSGVRRRRAL